MGAQGNLTPRGVLTPSNAPIALRDRFEIINECVGDGSFGSVCLARVRKAGSGVARHGTLIAIKTMKKQFESFAPCLDLREVVFLRTLPTHQHLVPALDIFLDPFTKKLHIAMEYMEANLYQLMKARDHKALECATVKSVLFQIMQGLQHIHDHHFFHRDIKPENILVSIAASQESRRHSAMMASSTSSPAYVVKIADFGLARETHSKLPYTTYVSTRWYRAPEVLLQAGEYSAPVDIWAIGAMAVEIATLKPLFPGGNEVDQVWRVCEIMGSPGNWCNKSGQRVGGGDWREGTKLAGKLGFSFPKLAPHAMETILQSPQWPASLSHFVTWCLMWDPKARPTSAQALAHEFFVDAIDPLRPKSSSGSRILGRKHSDLSFRASKNSDEGTPTSSKPSWFRMSLIMRNEANPAAVPTAPIGKENIAPPSVAVPCTQSNELSVGKARSATQKRTTWTNGPSMGAPMPILPSIKPVSPLSDTVAAQANNPSVSYTNNPKISMEDKQKAKIGRQLSVASNSHYDAEAHRHQAERALNGGSGLVSPPSGQKESFFSHLRKRARRFSGRHQTPISPASEDVEAQIGCGPWQSNRSSIVVDTIHGPVPVQQRAGHEALDKALRAVQENLDSPQQMANVPSPPQHQINPASVLKRHHSLPMQHIRSHDNLVAASRAPGPPPGRVRRTQPHGVPQYETPDEEDELLHDSLMSTNKVMKDMNRSSVTKNSDFLSARKPVGGDPARIPLLAKSNSGISIDAYPTPSPSANGSTILSGAEYRQRRPAGNNQDKWPTPPYEENEWAASATASIWAAGSRF